MFLNSRSRLLNIRIFYLQMKGYFDFGVIRLDRIFMRDYTFIKYFHLDNFFTTSPNVITINIIDGNFTVFMISK